MTPAIAAAAEHAAAQPAAGPAAAAEPAAADGARPPRKKHHLLRHELTVETQAAAVAHFGAATAEDAAHVVWTLKQRELQEAFSKVYGTPTASCNNEWMRGKLLQALGLNARWRPLSHPAPTPPPPVGVAAPDPDNPDGVSRFGRRRRAAVLAAMHLTQHEEEEEEEAGSPATAPRRAAKPAPKRGRASLEAPPASAVDAASHLLGAAQRQQGPPPLGFPPLQPQAVAAPMRQATLADLAPAFALGGSGLVAADAALALATGQQLQLTIQQQQQLLLLEEQHQQQQQRLHQQFLLQQRLLLQQQQAAAAAARATPPPPSSQPPQAPAAHDGWAPLAGPLSSLGLLGSFGALRQPLNSLSALAAAAGLPGFGSVPADSPPSALPPLGGLSWQLLSAARQQLDDGRLAAAELRKAGFGVGEAAGAAAEALLANDLRRLQGLPPAGVLPGLFAQAAPAAAAPLAVAGAPQPSGDAPAPARAAPPTHMAFNPFAMAAAAAAAAAAEQNHLASEQGGLPGLAGLPHLGLLGGPMPLAGTGVAGTLSTELHSLYAAWQEGNAAFMDP
ncbi:hypothetical protein C2E20_3461 [Micractinium conductrix]|uniref:Uncharacterized protein n=1 Tax=Micractinium conductrix TaxID=554055 RepID=A0A2P6VGM4_9CHLO|nr:hypothetical protein C2E20_3461 [Micractinium conductrix]|eukprot:PSC73231.1 hypothetical protein C2E20_3461 [Micractinium conductrix]